jgi:hypothetical protein
MANVKELREIFKFTPIDQAILLEGIHGIGKSEIVGSIAKENGAKIITIFLGQSADAGDVIGLPMRVQVTDEFGEYYITDFASPKWWPRDPNGQYYIFFDELNRAKPEMMQCIMDLVLNRRMNGVDLPKNTRIIAAMNPLEDGYYQVEELDPALMDRFNVYPFKPTAEEWLDWAMTKANIHDAVIGFIAKFKDTHLDPPSSKDAKSNLIYPSRRSWKRVSDILNQHAESLFDNTLYTLNNIVSGIVGIAATSAFIKHIKEMGTGLNAALILNKWDEKISDKVSLLPMQQQVHMISQICIWLDENSDKMLASKTLSKNILANLEKFIKVIHIEAQAQFFNKLKVDWQEHKKGWCNIVATGNPNLGATFKEVMRK